MKKKCKHQINNGWCKARGGTCIWSEYAPEACLKREERRTYEKYKDILKV